MIDLFERMAQHQGHSLKVTYGVHRDIVFLECLNCIEIIVEYRQQSLPLNEPEQL